MGPLKGVETDSRENFGFLLGGRGEGVGKDGGWEELELERNLTEERYRLRMLGLGGMPRVDRGDKPVMRVPMVVS